MVTKVEIRMVIFIYREMLDQVEAMRIIILEKVNYLKLYTSFINSNVK